MSATHDDGDSVKNVSVKVDEGKLEEFDRAIKRAQVEDEIPFDMSRSAVLRGFMDLVIEDPSILEDLPEADE